MPRRVQNASILFALTLSIPLVGCGPRTPPPVPVSGTVNLDGKPLAEGTIYFKTIQTGVIDAIPIKDGKFEGAVAEGERRVEITAYRSRIVGSGAMKGEIQESLVSNRFNINSTQTAPVKRDSANVFEFAVSSK